NQRHRAAERVEAHLFVELHHLFLAALRVLVLLLDLLDLRLGGLHGACRLELPDGEGNRREPKEECEEDDGEPELTEDKDIEKDQRGDQGCDKERIPGAAGDGAGEGGGDSDGAGLGEAEVACKRNGSERTVLPSSVGPHWREPSSGLRPYAFPLRSTTTSVPPARRGAARTESPVWKGLL